MQKSGFIREINGLRVIAATIVLAAHYSWVSGLTSGISLFFVITGFLSGAKIKRAIAAGEVLNFWPDLRSTLWRLLLPMHIVLLVVGIWILTSVDVMHKASWMKSIFAMSLGFGNQYEISNATTYWERSSILSPSLSMWAMSVLIQSSLVLAVVRFVVSRVAPKISDGNRKIILGILGLLAVGLSILDSIRFDGSTSYHFSTINWTWAFLLGLVLGGINWRIGESKISRLIADTTFFVILILGILPVIGYEPIGNWVRSAFAVMAAICLLAPTSGETFYQRFLNSNPMQFIGGITFGIYLIHWPLMIIYRFYTDSNQARHLPNFTNNQQLVSGNQMSIYSAIALTVVSVLLAWALQKLVDLVILKVNQIVDPKKLLIQFSSLALVPIFVFSLQSSSITSNTEIYKNLKPSLEKVSEDLPSYVTAECQNGVVEICSYGTMDADTVIAIVGTSTAGQWFDAVIPAANKYGWRIDVMIKEGCTHAEGSNYDFCNNWRSEVVNILTENKPDLVIMETTHANQAGTREQVEIQDSFIRNPLILSGIKIMGIRSTARFSFLVPECIAANANYEEVCGVSTDSFFMSKSKFAEAVDASQYILIADLTDVICPNSYCSPVDGNIIRYVDDKHFTKTYSATLSDELEPYMLEALGSN